VWEDHLLPLVACKEAVRLGSTCRVLRTVAREHYRGDLGMVRRENLKAALTTFPRARSGDLTGDHRQAYESYKLVEWLCVGGHGRHITTLTTTPKFNYDANETVHEALRRGAFPSLKNVAANLEYEAPRAALTEGLFGPMHELRLKLLCGYRLADQLAALGAVRQLPALAKLELEVCEEIDDPLQWPPFLPPSLKALRITTTGYFDVRIIQSLLRALPGMLAASGAALDTLRIELPPDFRHIDDGLVHVAQALHYCSRTLKSFHLSAGEGVILERADYEAQAEQLREQWAEVLTGVSTCRQLEVLELPTFFKTEPLFPLGAAFDRLTHLEIVDCERDRLPDADVMGLWEVMASGGLPALTKLCLILEGNRWGYGEEVKTRVAPAFGAVAGTLTHLHLRKSTGGQSDPVEVGYELGVAMGNWRRLRTLTLEVSQDGIFYEAMAQGLAASGADRPLPRLWQVVVRSRVGLHADLLASLVLPSVQVFVTCHWEIRAAVLTANALRQMGYKHVWAPHYPEESEDAVRRIAGCRADDPKLYGLF
jgi:hypothetical protein